MALHSAIRPRCERRPDPLAVDVAADQQARSGGGRKRHRGLQLWIIAATGALIGVGPAAVEDVFALRVRFQIAGHDAGDLAVEPGEQMPRTPAGAGAGRAGGFGGGKKGMGNEGVIARLLKSGHESPAAPGEASVSRFSRLFGSPFGLAQASHSAAGISLAEGTASRVISDDAIENSQTGPIAISHRDGDQHVAKDVALRPRLQGRAARIRFPAGNSSPRP